MIQLKNLFKQFGSRMAVDDLTLQVPAGEIYGLLGHNGAGKSTAIGMMLGQVWPTSGEVRICGHDVTAHRRLALQKVGAIFESPAFYDFLSGRRNLEILSSYTAATPRKRIQEVIEWVGLNGRADSKVRTYSHGMRARLALAQALLPHPELLILDEPSDGLDPEGIARDAADHPAAPPGTGADHPAVLPSAQRGRAALLPDRRAEPGADGLRGPLSATKQREQWVRLKVDDFAPAVSHLRQAELIKADRDGQFIALQPGSAPTRS